MAGIGMLAGILITLVLHVRRIARVVGRLRTVVVGRHVGVVGCGGAGVGVGGISVGVELHWTGGGVAMTRPTSGNKRKLILLAAS